MFLLNIVKELINSNDTGYTVKLFDVFKESIVTAILLNSPYNDDDSTAGFTKQISLNILDIISADFSNNFKLKKNITEHELQNILFHYIMTIANNCIDKALIEMLDQKSDAVLKNNAFDRIQKKYRGFIYELLYSKIRDFETVKTKKMNGYELETLWENESVRLTDDFFNNKFIKVISSFEKKNKKAIFRNYLTGAAKNYVIDYKRKISAREMKRLVIYRGEVHDEVFHKISLEPGGLFYYKKSRDCVTVRDYKKALRVINKYNIPSDIKVKAAGVFKNALKTAHFQKVIENIYIYLKDNCPEKKCYNKISKKNINAVIYSTDKIMIKKLGINNDDLDKAKTKLEFCIKCLGINKKEFEF